MTSPRYDYQRQRWVEGEEAERLGAEQDAAHAELMKDPAYRRFIGISDEGEIEKGARR